MGVALGLIHKTTREVMRKVKALGNSSAERQALSLATGIGPTQLSVPEDKGFVGFDTAKLGFRDDVDKIAVLAKRFMTDPARINADNKPFLRNILRSEDLFEHPEILRVAMHDQLFGAVTRYLGQVPWMVNLHIWWTPPNSTVIRSQLWHYDHRDTRQAKIFINLNEVDEAAGPLHFISAATCQKVDNTIGYSQKDYTDEQIASCVAPSDIQKATGPQGHGFVVDTARCLHYGSRGNTKDRLILMISYSRVNCVTKGAGCEVLDPVRERITETFYKNDPARAFAHRKP